VLPLLPGRIAPEVVCTASQACRDRALEPPAPDTISRPVLASLADSAAAPAPPAPAPPPFTKTTTRTFFAGSDQLVPTPNNLSSRSGRRGSRSIFFAPMHDVYVTVRGRRCTSRSRAAPQTAPAADPARSAAAISAEKGGTRRAAHDRRPATINHRSRHGPPPIRPSPFIAPRHRGRSVRRVAPRTWPPHWLPHRLPQLPPHRPRGAPLPAQPQAIRTLGHQTPASDGLVISRRRPDPSPSTDRPPYCRGQYHTAPPCPRPQNPRTTSIPSSLGHHHVQATIKIRLPAPQPRPVPPARPRRPSPHIPPSAVAIAATNLGLFRVVLSSTVP